MELAGGYGFVSTASNIIPPPGGNSGSEEITTTRPNPVALEVAVNVTGARPGGTSGSRDLFSEDTKTVLVFKDAAVIELTTPVFAGQLLFLTLKKTNQEVVCQVQNKRSTAPTMSYVELQFTEEKADFWGVAFPEGNGGGTEFTAAGQVQAEETTEGDRREPLPSQGAGQVDSLKEEVEALRRQLAELEKKNAAESARKASAGASAGFSKAKLELAPVNEQTPAKGGPENEVEAPLMPTAVKSEEARRPVIGMALPNRRSAEQKAGESESKTEVSRNADMDFSTMPGTEAIAGEKSVREAQAPKEAPSGKGRLIALSVVLLISLAGGAWMGQWWEYLPMGKASSVGDGARERAAKKAASAAGEAKANGAPTVGAGMPGAKTAVGNEPGAGPVNAEKKEETNSSAAGPEERGAGGMPAKVSAGSESATAGKASVTKREPVARKNSKAGETSAAEAVASDGTLVPAKLLKPATPVYPPDAMRNYITGDVRVEAVVEPNGRVGEVNVISGPQALREAAVEALKKYQYEPARQGGKAVASKVTEVVKFWFDP